MSHIFISYSHENEPELKQIIQALHDNRISDYWYDEEITVSDRWMPAIDRALEEADALIVIVTEEAMKSHYVTYEWSWALGNQTPVFPMIFKNDTEHLHEQLKALEYCECHQGITDEMIKEIQSKRITPPEIHYLNKKIIEMIMRFRIAVTVTLWAYEHIPNDHLRIKELANGLITETRKLYLYQLPEFIIQYRDVLQFGQLYETRQLASNLRESFYQAFMHPSDTTYQSQNANHEEIFPKVKDCWEKDVINSIEFFDFQYGWIEHYQRLKEYLHILSSNIEPHLLGVPYVINPDIIIKWAYGEDEYGDLLRNLITYVRQMKFKDKQ